ncbi:hypothetical protein ALCH109712_06705 [Alkalicoccus chagannorensis]
MHEPGDLPFFPVTILSLGEWGQGTDFFFSLRPAYILTPPG